MKETKKGLPEPEDPVVPGEPAGDNGCTKGASGVDGGTGVAVGKEVAGEDGQTVGEGRHESRAVLLVDDHVVDKAEDGCQEELEEETASNTLTIGLWVAIVHLIGRGG